MMNKTLSVSVILQAIALFTPTVAFGHKLLAIAESKVVTIPSKEAKKKAITSIGEIKQIAPPERSITSVKKITTKNLSPEDSVTSILRKVPGFNLITTGPGNLITTKTSEFTYEGFKSGQIAQTYDGVPITDPFNGGTGGRVNTRADIPITLSQIAGVKVYSGSGTPSQNTTNTLGGTIAYQAKKPTSKYYTKLSMGGGKYSHSGGVFTTTATINSGKIKNTGTKILASYSYTDAPSFLNNVKSIINSYYLSLIQPYNHGLSKVGLVAAYNHENANLAFSAPVNLIDKYGTSYQLPQDVGYETANTQSLLVIGSWKSVLNDYMIGKAKAFYSAQDYSSLRHSNPAYASTQYPNFLFYDGYPTPFTIAGYDVPGPTNSYNSIALFGSAYAGAQYSHYVYNTRTLGVMPSIEILLPKNAVQIGGSILHSVGYNYRYWYGSTPVPSIVGYNDAFYEISTRDISSAYIQDNASFLHGSLHIYPGLKYSITSTYETAAPGYYYKYGGVVGNTYYTWTPSLGINYSPVQEVNLFFSVGRTYKYPNLSGYYAVLGASPEPAPLLIKPEQATSYNTGIRYNSTFGDLTIAYFRSNFSSIFSHYRDPERGQTLVYNNGNALIQGLNIGLHIPLIEHLSFNGSYGYTSAKYTTLTVSPTSTTYPGQALPYMPQYTANAGLSYNNGPFALSLSGYFVGRQYIRTSNGNTIGLTLPAYQTMNLSASYKKTLHGFIKKVNVSLFADNLLNNNYLIYEQNIITPASYIEGVQGAPIYVGTNITLKF